MTGPVIIVAEANRKEDRARIDVEDDGTCRVLYISAQLVSLGNVKHLCTPYMIPRPCAEAWSPCDPKGR